MKYFALYAMIDIDRQQLTGCNVLVVHFGPAKTVLGTTYVLIVNNNYYDPSIFVFFLVSFYALNKVIL